MLYPLNEPVLLQLKWKPRLLWFLNHIPYRDYFLYGLAKKGVPGIQQQVIVHSGIATRPLVFRYIGISQGTVLDVGCCDSKLSIELASLGYQVYGIDINDYQLEHPNFHFLKEDIAYTSLPDNFFDVALAISTIEHVGLGYYGDPKYADGDKKALREIRRVLKPGGRLLMSFRYAKEYRVQSGDRIYNKASLKDLLIGFKVEKAEYFIQRGQSWLPCLEEEIEENSANEKVSIIFLVLSKVEAD